MQFIRLQNDKYINTTADVIRIEALQPGVTVMLHDCPNLRSINVTTHQRPLTDEHGNPVLAQNADGGYRLVYEECYTPFTIGVSYEYTPFIYRIISRFLHGIGYAPFICERHQGKHIVFILVSASVLIKCEQLWVAETSRNIERALQPIRAQ
jgi:hypothetical protein